MDRKTFKRFNTWHLLVLVLFVGAILQPIHSAHHNLQFNLFHADKTRLLIGDSAAFESFAEHREQHDTELCGQCQLGMMGDTIPSSLHFPAHYANPGYALSLAALALPAQTLVIRNRGPPVT